MILRRPGPVGLTCGPLIPVILATSQIEGRSGTGQESAEPITCDAEGALDAWSGGRRLACEEDGAVTSQRRQASASSPENPSSVRPASPRTAPQRRPQGR